MSEYASSVILLLVSVLISSVSQIILKISANKPHETRLKEYLNPYVIIAYLMFFGSTILTLLALRHLPLSQQPLYESAGYIFVSVMGYFLLKERFSKKKLLGLALILAGIFIFSL
ncbi:MAG: EamA family transporter [Lachnospiraceae bacterium]|nr:EamA family transporter [Lachnospiraceae bacterium]